MTPREPTSHGSRASTLARHGTGFFAAGGLAFAADAGILALLHHGLGFDVLLARVAAISVAMVVAWFAHRRLTFNVDTPPSLNEFTRFVCIASLAAALNYAAFAAILIIRPHTEPLIALAAATTLAMAASYVGMRFGVFNRAEKDASEL